MAKSLLLIATLSSIAAAAGVEREFFTAEFATAVQKLRESYELLPSPHSVTQLSYRENHVWCAQEPLRRLREDATSWIAESTKQPPDVRLQQLLLRPLDDLSSEIRRVSRLLTGAATSVAANPLRSLTNLQRALRNLASPLRDPATQRDLEFAASFVREKLRRAVESLRLAHEMFLITRRLSDYSVPRYLEDADFAARRAKRSLASLRATGAESDLLLIVHQAKEAVLAEQIFNATSLLHAANATQLLYKSFQRMLPACARLALETALASRIASMSTHKEDLRKTPLNYVMYFAEELEYLRMRCDAAPRSPTSVP